ncbi:YggT family protein [Euzebya sp.]|uniref:YggT family protein n=1 Tax=Euzebya sp. TaxID=1971409 RepID=UPI0035142A7D
MRTILCLALTVFYILLIVRVIFSWIPRPPDPLVPVASVVHTSTEWAVAPLRSAIPPLRMGAVGFDVSILIVFFAVVILQQLIC